MLAGRVAVVTGGASGIGAATAELLAGAGASVVIAGRSRERGEAMARALGEGGARAIFGSTPESGSPYIVKWTTGPSKERTTVFHSSAGTISNVPPQPRTTPSTRPASSRSGG
jgi:NAD(P)-dependent dehydrogenase (short-subunit alcohol dehydrogenase family)